MCILPNFVARDLLELKRKRKKETKKPVAKTMETVIPEQPLLESSI